MISRSANKPANDRRVSRTRLALREALLSLLEQHGWDELSIQKICETANIGRSTFYMHFQSKDELLSASLNDLRDALLAMAPSGLAQPFSFLPGLLSHMAENRRVFRNVIGRRSGHGVERRFRDMVYQLIEQNLNNIQGQTTVSQMQAHYFAGGIVDVMAWWVDAVDAPGMAGLEKFIVGQLSMATTPAQICAGQ